MILVGETDPVALEVPLYFPSAADPIYTGVAGHTFALGEVKLRTIGGSYTNVAVDHVIEKGYGIVAARATPAQAAAEGKLYVYGAIAGAQPYSGEEDVSTQAGAAIIIGETNPAARELAFHLPDAINPLTPFNGGVHAFTTGEVKLMLPGDVAFANADVANVVAKDSGDFALRLTGVQAAALRRGKAYLVVIVAGAQTWRDWYDIVEPFSAGGPLTAPVISNLTPVEGVHAGGAGEFSADYSTARFTPIEFDLTNIVAGSGITISAKFANRDEKYVALDHDGSWSWPFDVYCTIGDLAVEPVHVSLLPRDGWPPVAVDIKVAGVKPAVEP